MNFRVGDHMMSDRTIIAEDGIGQGFATLGDLVAAWKTRYGDPSKRLVGGDASKHLRDACKKHDIRSKDHS